MDVQFNITVDGRQYPCRLTMGAMQDFKRRTGHEVNEAEEHEVLDVVYYCARSEAIVSGETLPFTVERFPYIVSPDEAAAMLNAYTAALIAASEVDGAKKKTAQTPTT